MAYAGGYDEHGKRSAKGKRCRLSEQYYIAIDNTSLRAVTITALRMTSAAPRSRPITVGLSPRAAPEGAPAVSVKGRSLPAVLDPGERFTFVLTAGPEDVFDRTWVIMADSNLAGTASAPGPLTFYSAVIYGANSGFVIPNGTQLECAAGG